MKKYAVIVPLLAILFCNAMWAAEEAKTAPTSQPVVVVLSDKTAIDANMGKDVTVEGMVSDAQWSSSGKVFLMKFKEGDATKFQIAMFSKFRESMEKAFNGDLSNAFEGSKIQVTGKLQTYRDHPEILVNEPKQITVLVKGPGKSPHATTQPAAAEAAHSAN